MRLHNCLSFVLFLLLNTTFVFSQGNRCSNIQPFCAGTTQYVFSNSNVNNSTETNAETGPYYKCLETTPFPAWFYLKIEDPGNLDFEISQTVNPDGSGKTLDVDFIAWGPFSENQDFCNPSALSSANVVDCSFLPATTENFTIANAKVGQIYVVLLTNYSEAPGYISLSQTNSLAANAGSTDCSIINILGDDRKVCGDNSTVLKAMNVIADSYKWYKYDTTAGNFVQIPNESGSNLTITEAGKYKITAINSVTSTEISDEIDVTFAELPVAGEPQDLTTCSENRETAIFDLTGVDDELLQNYHNPQDFSTHFYQNKDDFEKDNPISNPEYFEGAVNQQIFATITKNGVGCASEPVNFILKIDPLLNISLADTTNLCVDDNGALKNTISLGKDLGPDYTYSWTPKNDPDEDGTENAIFYIEEIPSFQSVSLVVKDENSGCTASFSTQLKTLYPPGEVTVTISGSDFGDGYTVTAMLPQAASLDRYEFRLDNGNWQDSAIFNHVGPGDHTVGANQKNGCGSSVSQLFQLVGYPRFFTPNNDGYHDTWNIINNNTNKLQLYKLRIFDRYGKLLKELDPNGDGWNGTFNGLALPADDYWFFLEYSENGSSERKQFKGHFTLKR